MRRFTVEVMRRLDAAGIDSFLPDLPGCNESEQPLVLQRLEDWQSAAAQAARHFAATHILAIRAASLSVSGSRTAPASTAEVRAPAN